MAALLSASRLEGLKRCTSQKPVTPDVKVRPRDPVALTHTPRVKPRLLVTLPSRKEKRLAAMKFLEL